MPIKPYPTLLHIGEYTLDKRLFTLTHVYQKRRSMGRKRIFEYACNECQAIYTTCLNNEIRKEHPWLCRSCRTKAYWQHPEYRNALMEAYYRPEVVANRSERGKRILDDLWRNQRERMLEATARGHRTFEARLAYDDELLAAHLRSGRGYRCHYHNHETGVVCCFRSTLELRCALVFDVLNIEWQYEPKTFAVPSLNGKRYTPDFYLPAFNAYVEFKGYWRKHDKQKVLAFISDYPDITIHVVMCDTLQRWEQEIDEGRLKTLRWPTPCL